MRLRPSSRGLALLAVTGLTLASAQVASAQSPPPTGNQPPPTGQQPPTGNQPPTGQQPPAGNQPPAAPQQADLSITLEAKDDDVDEGERFSFKARIANHGPGIARAVKVIVSTPEEFDLDDTNKEVECETHPEGQGRMVCSFGDLAPREEGELNFRGEFRDHGRTRTHVSIQSLTPDPNSGNDADDEQVRVHENEVVEDLGPLFACEGGPARLIGGDSPFAPATFPIPDSGGEDIEVVADLEVRLNGETIFEDDNGQPQFSGFPGGGPPLDPIDLEVKAGDRLQVTARGLEIVPGFFFGFLDPLTLQCPDGSEQELTDGAVSPPPGNREFFDEEFVIELGRNGS